MPTLETHPFIEIRDLSFQYSANAKPIIQIDEWKIRSGARVFLEGESGSGKSTLLKLLSGIHRGTGVLKISQKDLSKMSNQKRNQFRANNIGMVLQQFNLIPYLSSKDNLLLAASLSRNNSKETIKKAETLLDNVGISKRDWNKYPEKLSTGQQQRIAIARALINTPNLLLFDEPTSSLDENNTYIFMKLLFKMLEQHPSTLIFVSHDQRLASHFAERVSISRFSSKESFDDN